MSPKSRAVSAKGVLEYKPHVTRCLPVGAIINCTDNSGARKLKIIQVLGYGGRLRRVPQASVGDMTAVSIKEGRPELRKQIFRAVIVRQKKMFSRPDGTWIQFEDNAAVIMTPEGELRGSEIKGPVAREAAERWPRIASMSKIII